LSLILTQMRGRPKGFTSLLEPHTCKSYRIDISSPTYLCC
jgi:hypothetical protein